MLLTIYTIRKESVVVGYQREVAKNECLKKKEEAISRSELK